MKDIHHAIAAVVLSIVFVIVGFAATVAAIVSNNGVAYSIIGYVATLLGFLIILWILMLILMRKDPVTKRGAQAAGRRR